MISAIQPAIGPNAKIERLFADSSAKSEAVREKNEIRKRVLLSSHFGTAFKIKKTEDMLMTMKEL